MKLPTYIYATVSTAVMFTGCAGEAYQHYAKVPVFEMKCTGNCNLEQFTYYGQKAAPKSIGEDIASVIGAATPFGAVYFLTDAIKSTSGSQSTTTTTTSTVTDKTNLEVVKPEIVQIKPEVVQVPTTIVKPEIIQVPKAD